MEERTLLKRIEDVYFEAMEKEGRSVSVCCSINCVCTSKGRVHRLQWQQKKRRSGNFMKNGRRLSSLEQKEKTHCPRGDRKKRKKKRDWADKRGTEQYKKWIKKFHLFTSVVYTPKDSRTLYNIQSEFSSLVRNG